MKRILFLFVAAAMFCATMANKSFAQGAVASFTVTATSFCQNASQYFTNTSYIPAGHHVSCDWEFGSSSIPYNSDSMQPLFWVSYGYPGSQTATLTLHDSTAGTISTCSKVLTVKTVPYITSTTPSAPMLGCGHDSVSLTATTSFPASIVWTRPSLAHDTASLIEATTDGLYYVSALSSEGCLSTSMYALTVGTYPAVTAYMSISTYYYSMSGDTMSVCADTHPWINSYYSGGTYPYTSHWNTGSTAMGFALSTSGIYKITVTDANGCTGSDSAYVYLNNGPDTAIISSSLTGTACEGDTVTLTATPGYPSYSWAMYGIGNHNQAKVTWSGVYEVTITDSNGCTATSAPMTIMFNVPPSPTVIVDHCNMASSTLDVGATYQWYKETTAVPGATSQFYTSSEPGFYRVAETLLGCTGNSPYVYSECVTAVQNIANDKSTHVYPNPFTDQLNVSEPGNFTVSIYNMMGQEVVSQIATDAVDINTSSFPAGIYMLAIEKDGVRKQSKILKE